MATDGNFVGRRRQLSTILGGGPGVGALYVVSGIPGSGMSMLLQQLYREAAGDREDLAVLVKMEDVLLPSDLAEVDGAGVPLGEERRRFCDVLSKVVRPLPPHPETNKIIDAVTHALRAPRTGSSGVAARGPGPRIGGGFLGSGPSDSPSARPSPAGDDAAVEGEVRELIDQARSAAAALARDMARGDGSREGQRIYVLVDTFDLVMQRPLGRWLLDLLCGLNGMVVVIAHHEVRRVKLKLPDSAQRITLGGLGEDDVRRYLTAEEGVGPDLGDIVEPVMAFTGGHAQAVALTANLIRDNGGPAKSTNLLRQLAAMDADSAQKLGRLVEKIIGSATDPEIAQGLDAVWVVRRFDTPLLEDLLEIGQDRARALVERLTEYSFVEQRTDAAAAGQFAAQRFIREYGAGLLRYRDPERYQQLHQAAEKYYQQQLTDYPASYEEWYRYEDDKWQAGEREWLYHVAHLDGPGRASARLGVARLFLDTFWWWGNYVPFSFCEEVLDDWAEIAEVQGDELNRAWGENLRRVYELYPKGWRREQGRAGWRRVRQSLLYLRERGELGGPSPANPTARHVRGILHIYLADANRHLDPESPDVVDLLRDARAQFEANGDEWDLSWLPFQEADAAIGRGDADEATTLVDGLVRELRARAEAAKEPGARGAAGDQPGGQRPGGAAQGGPRGDTAPGRPPDVRQDTPHDDGPDDDRELRANLHRIYADAAWIRKDPGLALDFHARAVLHAYHFQLRDSLDEYTAEFITEMHERAAERLAELYQAGQAETVRAACARIRSFFRRYWQFTDAPAAPDFWALLASGDHAGVVRELFPAAPSPADLHRKSTDYELDALDFFAGTTTELAKPPGTPLPQT